MAQCPATDSTNVAAVGEDEARLKLLMLDDETNRDDAFHRDTTLDADLLKPFTEPDMEEREVQERLDHERDVELQLRTEEFLELQKVYTKKIKRSFHAMRQFPEPQAYASCVCATEEDLDAGLYDDGVDHVDAPCDCASCTKPHRESSGVASDLLGSTPTRYEMARKELEEGRWHDDDNNEAAHPPRKSRFVARVRRNVRGSGALPIDE